MELLEQVLLRLEQSLPSFGLELNFRKCVLVSATPPEVRTFPRLAEVLFVDIRDENQGFKVLEVPLGGSSYVKKVLEETAENVAHFCEQVVDLDHPQMGFILLRQCCGTCRVVHLLRAWMPANSRLPTSCSSATCTFCRSCIRQTPLSTASLAE